MKVSLAIFFILSAAGCATYNAQLISATADPRAGVVALTFNEEGKENAQKMAKFIMRKFCDGGFKVTKIEMAQETNSGSTIVPIKTQYMTVYKQKSNSRTEFSNQPIVHFQCRKENPGAASELDL